MNDMIDVRGKPFDSYSPRIYLCSFFEKCMTLVSVEYDSKYIILATRPQDTDFINYDYKIISGEKLSSILYTLGSGIIQSCIYRWNDSVDKVTPDDVFQVLNSIIGVFDDSPSDWNITDSYTSKNYINSIINALFSIEMMFFSKNVLYDSRFFHLLRNIWLSLLNGYFSKRAIIELHKFLNGVLNNVKKE